MGNGYLGSPSVQVSTSNQEIIPAPAAELRWTTGYYFYKFSFDNDSACSAKINGGNPIHIRAGVGFETEPTDAPIYSFVVVESGIPFSWIGAY